MTFSTTLQTLRRTKYRSAHAAATSLGVPVSTWQAWEGARRIPAPHTQNLIIKDLSTRPDRARR